MSSKSIPSAFYLENQKQTSKKLLWIWPGTRFCANMRSTRLNIMGTVEWNRSHLSLITGNLTQSKTAQKRARDAKTKFLSTKRTPNLSFLILHHWSWAIWTSILAWTTSCKVNCRRWHHSNWIWSFISSIGRLSSMGLPILTCSNQQNLMKWATSVCINPSCFCEKPTISSDL